MLRRPRSGKTHSTTWAGLKTLSESPESDGQRRWMGRSPAMAAGLTEHIWEIEELLTTLPLHLPTLNRETTRIWTSENSSSTHFGA